MMEEVYCLSADEQEDARNRISEMVSQGDFLETSQEDIEHRIAECIGC